MTEKVVIFLKKKEVKTIWIAILVFLTVKYLFPLFLPVILGIFFVIPLNPLFTRIQRRTGIKKGITAGIVLALVAVLLAGVFWFLLIRVMDLTGFATDYFPAFEKKVMCVIENCCCILEKKVGFDAIESRTFLYDCTDNLMMKIRTDTLPKMMGDSAKFIKKIMTGFAFLMIAIIAAVLLAKDMDRITEQLGRYSLYRICVKAIEKVGSFFGVYLKAQGLIMSCVILTASFGLLLLKQDYAIVFGVLAGILDVLPFIGTGFVLMPLTIWMMLEGMYVRAAGCFVLYLVCILIREYLEPRLLGKSLRIEPIIMLASVYAGIKLLGLIGVFMGPIILLMVRELVDLTENENK